MLSTPQMDVRRQLGLNSLLPEKGTPWVRWGAFARGHLRLLSQTLRAPLPPAGLTRVRGDSTLTGSSVIRCPAVGIGGTRALSSASGSYSGEWRQQYPPVSACTQRKAPCPHVPASGEVPSLC